MQAVKTFLSLSLSPLSHTLTFYILSSEQACCLQELSWPWGWLGPAGGGEGGKNWQGHSQDGEDMSEAWGIIGQGQSWIQRLEYQDWGVSAGVGIRHVQMLPGKKKWILSYLKLILSTDVLKVLTFVGSRYPQSDCCLVHRGKFSLSLSLSLSLSSLPPSSDNGISWVWASSATSVDVDQVHWACSDCDPSHPGQLSGPTHSCRRDIPRDRDWLHLRYIRHRTQPTRAAIGRLLRKDDVM